MCGRYSNDKNVDDMAKAYQAAGGRGADFMAAWSGRFSLAPTDAVPIVREALDDGTIERELKLARWDFRPHWRTDARPLINARLEPVAEKPTFREAFLSRRAIPMSGYFEWTGSPKDKTPHYVSAGGELLSAAGLYAFRKVGESDAGDEWEISCVVLTRTAVDAAGEVHDRMPVFLTPEVWDDWLTPEKLTDKAGALSMLEHSSNEIASTLESCVVDRKVNSVRSVDPDDPSIIEPGRPVVGGLRPRLSMDRVDGPARSPHASRRGTRPDRQGAPGPKPGPRGALVPTMRLSAAALGRGGTAARHWNCRVLRPVG